MNLKSKAAFCLLSALLFAAASSYAQNASSYIPTQPGTVWTYETVDLDSLNSPIELTRRNVADSLIGTGIFRQRSAQIFVRVPVFPAGPTPPSASDTTALVVSADSIIQLFRGLPMVGVLGIFDTVGLSYLTKFEGWYTTMKFGSPPANGVPDTLLRIDTVLTYDGSSYNVRIVATRTRLSTRSVTVPAGVFSAVPFAYRIIADAFAFGPVRLAEVYDTVFVAQNVGVVRAVRASAPLPVQPLPVDIPGSYVRGYVKELKAKTTVGVKEWRNGGEEEFWVDGPYPNPFNPLTIVDFRLSNSGWVKISVYDLLGREVDVLLNEETASGAHVVRWNASGHPSGVYFVRVVAGTAMQTKKVVLAR